MEELCTTVAAAGAGTSDPAFCGRTTEHKLRMTGLQEDEEESQHDLLQKVQSVLDSLPRKFSAVSAQRQGHPGGKRARAVVITFANAQGRSDILRTKAALSRHDNTRSYSINELLTSEEQQHKNAMCPCTWKPKLVEREPPFEDAIFLLTAR